MSVVITDERIVAHCRAKGMAGPISPEFIDEYRMGMARDAVSQALLDAGAEPGAIHPQHWVGAEARAARRLQEMVDAL